MTGKPIGPIPPEFAAAGALHLGGQTADALVEAHGSPLFVYDRGVMAARITRFRQAFAGIDLHYAIKANPNAALLGWMAERVDGFDTASAGEIQFATEAAAHPRSSVRDISIAGPGKSDDELVEARRRGVTVNVESIGEAARIDRLSRDGDGPFRVAVRVNPDFELRGSGMRMGGGARPFGVDVDQVPVVLNMLQRQQVRGFHIYAGSQSLDAEAIIDAQRRTIDLAARLSDAAGIAPELVNLGGGFGVPYFAGDTPLDIDAVGAGLAASLAQRPAVLADTRFAIELGRWLVAEAGVYLTRVLDRKTSHGELFLVTDGGLHHQLAASGNFGTVVRRNYPIAVAARIGAAPDEVATVVGRLCTPLDRLGDRIALPRAEVGDVIAIFLAGAYGRSASPAAFLGHPAAAEVLVG
ncbi:diaminopimelate decarboxylase [Sphingomonas jejuensis]|uniref:Diaminopimelate decarboxylase n=1 Tax=Sphingomonas jejuensis TaxID=904715 RepID=A0ABX0XKD0_9SPHN|nr:pyridoxal-dependent decarboxylase, exosortase A system-associated [Sphingomonas jejuensis]NJC33309.1 diaminopimelate decarboxylase [Sphingomonas jejuensis]